MASSSRRRLVVLDTNVLVHIADLHFDLFSRLEEVLSSSFAAAIPSKVIDELKRISQEKPPLQRRKALLALKLAEKCLILPSEEFPSVDEFLEKEAPHQGWIVFTDDMELRRRLRRLGVTTLFIKDGHIMVDGEI